MFFVVKVFSRVEPLFASPISSKEVGIYKVSRLSCDLTVLDFSLCIEKCIALPFRDSLVAIEFLS